MANPISSLEGAAAGTVESAVGFGLGFALGRALTPVGNTIIQEAYGKDPNKPLDAQLVAQMIAEGLNVSHASSGEAVLTGISSDRLASLVELVRVAPGSGELLRLIQRGHVTSGDVTTALNKARVLDQYRAGLIELANERLDPAVIAVSIQRGTMHDPGYLPVGPPSGTGKVPPMPVSSLDPVREAADSGVDADRLAVMTRNVGLPPGPGELMQLVNRGVIEPVDFARGIAEGNTRNEWAPFLIELKRRLLSPHEYAELALRGWITPAEMHSGAALEGMESADADLLFKLLGRPLAVHQVTTGEARGGTFGGDYEGVPSPYLEALRESNVRPEWGNLAYANRYTLPSAFVIRSLLTSGELSEAEGEKLFLESGWPPDLAAKVAKAASGGTGTKADPHLVKAQTQLWGTIHKSYVAEESDGAEATSALDALGVPGDVQPAIVALWDHERAIIRRQLSASQVKKLFTETKWTRDEAKARLMQMGYNATDADLYLGE